MNKKILVLLILLLLPIRINALQDNTLLYDENPTHYKGFHNVIVDQDNNIVAVGFDLDEANNSYKSIISKYQPDGTLIWEKDFLVTDRENRAYGITLAQDGYIVVGGSHVKTADDDTDNSFDNYIYKISKDGEVVWHKEESTTGSNRYEKIITVGDGYVAAGYASSEYFIPSGEFVDKNAYIRKVDAEGNKVWEHTFEGNNLDWFYSLAQDGDSIIAVGYTASTNIDGLTNKGERDGLVVKYNADGTVAWAKNYGEEFDDEIRYVSVVSDGYILTGISDRRNGSAEEGNSFWFLKINKDGEVVWQNTYHKVDDEAWSIIPKDDKYYAFGHTLTDTTTGKYESYVLEINSTGEVENTYKYEKSAPVLFRNATPTEDGFIVVGFTRVLGATANDIFAGPLMVKYSFTSNTPGDDSHGAVDPTTEEPTTEPETKPQPQEDNPKTGAFLTSGLVILVLVGLLIYNIRKKDTFNI